MAVKTFPGNQAPDGGMYVTLTDGAGNLISNANTNGGISISNGATVAAVNGQSSDAVTANTNGLAVQDFNYIFNGTTWDRARGAAGAADAMGTGLPLAGGYTYNGTNWDRSRSILGAGTTSGSTGLQAVCLAPSTNSNAGLANTATSAASGSLVLKASAGNLYSLCANAGASAGYLMVFDATAAPADGAVTPVYSMPIAANGSFFTDFAYPIRCTTGITLVFSTTGPFTKTISNTAFLSGQFL